MCYFGKFERVGGLDDLSNVDSGIEVNPLISLHSALLADARIFSHFKIKKFRSDEYNVALVAVLCSWNGQNGQLE